MAIYHSFDVQELCRQNELCLLSIEDWVETIRLFVSRKESICMLNRRRFSLNLQLERQHHSQQQPQQPQSFHLCYTNCNQLLTRPSRGELYPSPYLLCPSRVCHPSQY
ncbi:hypothetical protein FALCPG4_013199 [Fusarium falciforme]